MGGLDVIDGDIEADRYPPSQQRSCAGLRLYIRHVGKDFGARKYLAPVLLMKKDERR